MSMRRHRKHNNGFSLIEILFVLAVVGILMGLGINSYLREYQKRQFVEELTRLSYYFEQARATSVKTSVDQTVQLAMSGSKVTLTYNGTTVSFTNLAFCDKTSVTCGTTAQFKYLSPHGEFCWSSACSSQDAYLNFTRNNHSANLVLQGVFGYASIRDVQ